MATTTTVSADVVDGPRKRGKSAPLLKGLEHAIWDTDWKIVEGLHRGTQQRFTYWVCNEPVYTDELNGIEIEKFHKNWRGFIEGSTWGKRRDPTLEDVAANTKEGPGGFFAYVRVELDPQKHKVSCHHYERRFNTAGNVSFYCAETNRLEDAITPGLLIATVKGDKCSGDCKAVYGLEAKAYYTAELYATLENHFKVYNVMKSAANMQGESVSTLQSVHLRGKRRYEQKSAPKKKKKVCCKCGKPEPPPLDEPEEKRVIMVRQMDNTSKALSVDDGSVCCNMCCVLSWLCCSVLLPRCMIIS